MKVTIKLIAGYVRQQGLSAAFVIYFLSLSACALPPAPARSASYDLGMASQRLAPPSAQPLPTLAPLIMADIETSPTLDSTAMHYRLAYASPQQLHPYAQARWRVPPAQLLRQRLRERLGETHLLLNPGDKLRPPSASTAVPTAPVSLRLELEDFSQLFDAPSQSSVLLRLRATLTQASPSGAQVIAQRLFTHQHPAPSPDAPGGVQALTEASEAVARALEAWLAEAVR